METEQLQAALNRLVGHLIIDTTEDNHKFDRLGELLAKTSFATDSCAPIKQTFSFEKSDLFFEDKISKKTQKSIALVAKSRKQAQEEPQFRVFKREVPAQNHLIYGSVPTWAVGAKVESTVGPFLQADGRKFWFDFYRIQKFSELYIQGLNSPVLLFKGSQSQIFEVDGTVSLGRRGNNTFTLAKGSLWITSSFLAANAPAGSYTGLTVLGGKIILNNDAQVVNGKLTVAANTAISLKLELDQPEVSNANPESAFGIDARTMQLALPKNLSFHFATQERKIDEVSESKWQLYGQGMDFTWNEQSQAEYLAQLAQIHIPLQASSQQLEIMDVKSPFNTWAHGADIQKTGWLLPVAAIDITQPGNAAGIGALWAQGKKGITAKWQGLQNAALSLKNPSFIVAPGLILITDTDAGNPHATQSLDLWQDETNPFGAKVELTFAASKPFLYLNNADGHELIMYSANAEFLIDRPVKVDGTPPEIRSLDSLLLIAVSDTHKLIYLFDDNIIQDETSLSGTDAFGIQQFALALENALFKTSGVNGCLLFGALTDDYAKVHDGALFLTFGLFRYVPTLPDPYAANLGILRGQVRPGFRDSVSRIGGTAIGQGVNSWLVCRVKWEVPEGGDQNNAVEVSFHFAPLDHQFGGISLNDLKGGEPVEKPVADAPIEGTTGFLAVNNPIKHATGSEISTVREGISFANATTAASFSFTRSAVNNAATAAVSNRENLKPLADLEEIWDGQTSRLREDWFSLLDVSSNADLFGISFNLFPQRDGVRFTPKSNAQATDQFPFQAEGMKVVSQGINVKTFTVPQISWEPLINITAPEISGDHPGGFNYYPNDGGPMHIINTGEDSVALAPIPLTDYLLKNFKDDTQDFKALSFLTLPFGMRALALLENKHKATLPDGTVDTRTGSKFTFNSEEFENDITGGRQIRLDAGEAFITGESNMFVGSTVQINNVLDFQGNPTGDSTLGRTVTDIFNNEFLLQPFEIIRQRGVPLTRIDLSGYGATTFSNWLNPSAAFAATSQAKFDVVVGRCAHEIIQVVSMIYPWAIKVVRTITIYRVGTGYVYRHDSGWRAESEGRFDFRYFVNENPVDKIEKESPYEIHPGIVKGLLNVQNIIETDAIKVEEGQMISAKFVDSDGLYKDNPATADMLDFKLQPVYFDADIEVENLTTGFVEKTVKGEKKKVVPSKKIVGYVQSAPRGIPITKETLRNLVTVQLGAIGGPLDCEVNLANSDQKMRLNRFDFNNSFGDNGSDITYALTGRGSVLLPKDGSWSMVKHERSNGEVSPVPADLSIPVIRKGKVLTPKKQPATIEITPDNALLRIADPADLLRQPTNSTVNFGFLQSTDTQKALFLAPSFEWGSKKLNSKIPPLFVDAFRIVNSKGIFPNIGDATTNFGKAVPLLAGGVNPFPKGTLQDLGQDIQQLMDITDTIDNVKQQGYQLIKEGINKFDLPNTEFDLIDLGDGNFRIYIEYKGKNDAGTETKGDLDFNINSLAQGAAETWKSKMENVGIVVDLAGIDRLMRISGSWDSKKGQEASYPGPKLEFSPVLQPVIDILEILQQIQGEDYAGAVASGLKLAMSNKAGSWEYKFEASKEIPVLRFPVPDFLYNDPNAPFKLEAGLKLGAYFNAALQVTTQTNELLPSAGGTLGFYGRLSVMCVSLSAATVYAIGQVNLDIGADTKGGPTLHMKFGFGAQIVVGLPVAGNVSVVYMVGVEIFTAEGDLQVSAFLLFEGHAEILAGLVSITIRIEAKGTVSRKALPDGNSRADMAAQVTFGLDISIAFIINISFTESWQEQRQIA